MQWIIYEHFLQGLSICIIWGKKWARLSIWILKIYLESLFCLFLVKSYILAIKSPLKWKPQNILFSSLQKSFFGGVFCGNGDLSYLLLAQQLNWRYNVEMWVLVLWGTHCARMAFPRRRVLTASGENISGIFSHFPLWKENVATSCSGAPSAWALPGSRASLQCPAVPEGRNRQGCNTSPC